MEVISVFKLMKLELKKFPMKGYIRGAGIAMTVVLLFMVLLFWTTVLEGEEVIDTQADVVGMVTIIVNDVFLIMTAVMFANYIIGEYSSGTINILFTYPISRKKLIWSKIFLVCGYMTIVMIVANIFVMGALALINQYTITVPVMYDLQFLMLTAVKIVTNAVAFSLIGTLCLYFGMMKKSKVATIVSSVIIVSILGSTSNGFSLSSIIFIPLTVALIGISLIFFTFRKIEEVDV